MDHSLSYERSKFDIFLNTLFITIDIFNNLPTQYTYMYTYYMMYIHKVHVLQCWCDQHFI